MPMGFWLLIAVIMAVVEVASAGLITMWFVVGALIAFLAAFLGASQVVQIVVFLVVSIICLVCLRPVILKHRNQGPSAEPDMVGKSARVVERIAPHDTGRVETSDHMTWAARVAGDEPLEVGEKVVVVAQKSITLIVERKQA